EQLLRAGPGGGPRARHAMIEDRAGVEVVAQVDVEARAALADDEPGAGVAGALVLIARAAMALALAPLDEHRAALDLHHARRGGDHGVEPRVVAVGRLVAAIADHRARLVPVDRERHLGDVAIVDAVAGDAFATRPRAQVARALREPVAEHFRDVRHQRPVIPSHRTRRPSLREGSSMRRYLWLGTAALLFTFGTAACGSARLVQRNQYGGVIALNGDRNKAMEQANNMMAQHCGPGNFKVVSEGEVPVGTDTYAQSNTNYGESTQSNRRGTYSNTQGGATTTSGQSTRTETE